MIAITGATGNLGREVVRLLLKRVAAPEIAAVVRSAGKAQDLAALGMSVREADYSKPETLTAAFTGAEKVLLISSSEVGQRIPQHLAVVDAAKKAGAKLLVYTSILSADTSPLVLAQEHSATEEYIRNSGIAFVILRNGWYLENQTGALAPVITHGAILGAAGDGRFAAAARADYAEAAVAVLTADGHAGRTYELGGDVPYTLTELAAEVSKQTGKTIAYHNLPQKQYAEALVGFGLPETLAQAVADAEAGAANGALDTTSHDLNQLLGRPTTSLSAAVSSALKA
jgi:NAD(P)H dehydrogenase (quinone)